MASDYYQILGVAQTATEEEIRKAYYQMAKLFHPDRYSGSGGDEKFKLLNEAYRTLINPAKRRRYDFMLKYGSEAPAQTWAQKDRQRRYTINYEMLRRRREAARQQQEGVRRNFRALDRFIFWSLLITGIAGLVFSTIDAVLNFRFYGLLFFLVIIFWIWYSRKVIRTNKKQ